MASVSDHEAEGVEQRNQSIDIPNPPKIRDKVGIQKVQNTLIA